MELIDIGVNLTHESFRHDLDAVLHRAAVAGVHQMIVTGTHVQATREALALCAEYPTRLRATAGLHPHHASDFTPAVRDTLRELSAQPGIVAVGECGLDYFRNLSPPEDQRAAFAGQLEIAVERGLPVFLHQRDAQADFAAMLREYLPRLRAGVAHCFTGSEADLEQCLSMGLHIGITGWICDERRGRHLLPLMARIPADRLMIETDAPYLLPRTLRPPPATRRNEPVFLPVVAEAVAAARGEPVAALAESTTATARRFFGLDQFE